MSSTVHPITMTITILPRANLESLEEEASPARAVVDTEVENRARAVDITEEERVASRVVGSFVLVPLLIIKKFKVKKEVDVVSYYGHLKHGTLTIMTLKKFG